MKVSDDCKEWAARHLGSFIEKKQKLFDATDSIQTKNAARYEIAQAQGALEAINSQYEVARSQKVDGPATTGGDG